jgi:subtilisin family serine protease
MDPLTLTKIQNLMNVSKGDPSIKIALIDGPVYINHPAFENSIIKDVKESQLVGCSYANSIACIHGTFIAGILCAKRGVSAPAICPECTLLLRPIFSDKLQAKNNSNYIDVKKENQGNHIYFPSSSPEELAEAIVEVVDKGAKIINLSLGLSTSSLTLYPKLQESYDYARKNGVIIVASAGNQGNIGGISLIDNDWIIPVVSCNEYGTMDSMSNIGYSVRIRGIMAPGINVLSTYSGNGGYMQMSGTSFSAPFVTGALALLWSIFPKATAGQIVYSIKKGNYSNSNRTIIPSLFNAKSAYNTLRNTVFNS